MRVLTVEALGENGLSGSLSGRRRSERIHYSSTSKSTPARSVNDVKDRAEIPDMIIGCYFDPQQLKIITYSDRLQIQVVLILANYYGQLKKNNSIRGLDISASMRYNNHDEMVCKA